MESPLRSRRPIRVGAVSYLNTKPLVYRLTEFAPRIELSFDLPSRLADSLTAGELDVALIPSIEAFQNAEFRVISNACIGCRGPVLSVKLFSRVPLSQIQTLAWDEGSRTSVALVRILLGEQFGVHPRLEKLPIGHSIDDTDADAVLLIGDRAIHAPQERFAAVWDLGEQWCRWAELPFVFAMWTARPGFESRELAAALEDARDCGVAHLEEIAAHEAAVVGLSVPACVAYLRDNLHFYLGSRECQALHLFQRHAEQFGMAPSLALDDTLLSTLEVASSNRFVKATD